MLEMLVSQVTSLLLASYNQIDNSGTLSGYIMMFFQHGEQMMHLQAVRGSYRLTPSIPNNSHFSFVLSRTCLSLTKSIGKNINIYNIK